MKIFTRDKVCCLGKVRIQSRSVRSQNYDKVIEGVNDLVRWLNGGCLWYLSLLDKLLCN